MWFRAWFWNIQGAVGWRKRGDAESVPAFAVVASGPSVGDAVLGRLAGRSGRGVGVLIIGACGIEEGERAANVLGMGVE